MFKLNDTVYVIIGTKAVKATIIEIIQRNTYTKYAVDFEDSAILYFFEHELYASKQFARKKARTDYIRNLETQINTHKEAIRTYQKEIIKLKKEKI